MIGYALTNAAVREGTEVYAVVRPDTGRKDRIVESSLVHPVFGSLESLSEIKDIPADCDALYHFAWAGTDKANRDNPKIQEKNIQYTLDAIELAEKYGCHRFIGAGSQAEYGPKYDLIDEQTKCDPVSSYGIAKYAAGKLSGILCERKGMEHIWGRIFSVYGPHDNRGTMIDQAISSWNKGETAFFSAAVQMWNYLHETDAGEMFYRLGSEKIQSGTWLIANDQSMVLRDYITIMMDAYGAGAKAEFNEPGADKVPGLNVNIQRTVDALSYSPKIDFKEGIAAVIKGFTI